VFLALLLVEDLGFGLRFILKPAYAVSIQAAVLEGKEHLIVEIISRPRLQRALVFRNQGWIQTSLFVANEFELMAKTVDRYPLTSKDAEFTGNLLVRAVTVKGELDVIYTTATIPGLKGLRWFDE
jgi:hypothetical protein